MVVENTLFSDVMMPEKDGFELTQMLKNAPRTSHTPIILLTAKADIQSRLEGLERGADAYLPKPFNRAELLIRIRKLPELRQKLQAHYLALAGGQLSAEARTAGAPATERQEDAFVLKAHSIVQAHLSDPEFPLGDFCRELAISRSQAHRKLTALTGYSPNQFIRFVRLAEAKSLLLNSGLTISEVAYEVGFADPGYFSRVFKKEFGGAPSAYAKQERQ